MTDSYSDIVLIEEKKVKLNHHNDESLVEIIQETRACCPLCFELIDKKLEQEHFNQKHKEIECPFCGKLFHNESKLNRHVESHLNENQSQFLEQNNCECPICFSKFKDNNSLEIHVNLHFNASQTE